MRGVAWRDSQKRNKAPRGAERGENALRSNQCSFGIHGDELRRWLARYVGARASIPQIDLPPCRRAFDEIGRTGTECDVAAAGTDRGRAAVVVPGGAIGRHG